MVVASFDSWDLHGEGIITDSSGRGGRREVGPAIVLWVVVVVVVDEGERKKNGAHFKIEGNKLLIDIKLPLRSDENPSGRGKI